MPISSERHQSAGQPGCGESGCRRQLPEWAFCGTVSRSQLAQDLWALMALRGRTGGFFLEIGANHPEALSNTFLLESAAGWRPGAPTSWEDSRGQLSSAP